jgi:hypothetical protein
MKLRVKRMRDWREDCEEKVNLEKKTKVRRPMQVSPARVSLINGD